MNLKKFHDMMVKLKRRHEEKPVKVHVVPPNARPGAEPVKTTATPGTADFAMIVKLKFAEKVDEMRKEFGPDIFDKYCAVIFGARYADGAGICDGIDGRNDALLLLIATCVHRIADTEMNAQRFLPKKKSYSQIMANVCAKMMVLCQGMTTDAAPGADTPPAPPTNAPRSSGIIIP